MINEEKIKVFFLYPMLLDMFELIERPENPIEDFETISLYVCKHIVGLFRHTVRKKRKRYLPSCMWKHNQVRVHFDPPHVLYSRLHLFNGYFIG